MRLAPLLLALLFVGASAHAQGWERTYGGPDTDSGYAVAPMPDGGFAAVGFFGVSNSLSGFVVRTDAAGDTLWTRVLDRSAYDERAYDLVPLQDGGVLVIAAAYFPAPIYAFRPWLVRLDADGEIVFSTEDGLSQELPVRSGIVRGAERADGTIVLAGGSNGFSDPAFPWRAIVSAKGELLDYQPYRQLIPGFGSGTYVESVAVTPDGGFVLGGGAGGGIGQAFLWKFSAKADSAWVRFYGAEGLRTAFSTRVDPDGGFALTGCTLANCADAAVVRTDAAGDVRWSRTYAGSDYTQARDIALREDGTALLLRVRFSAFGTTRFDTELVALDPDGEVTGVTLLEGGASTTGGQGSVFLDRIRGTGGGGFVAVGRRFDNGNPSESDLYLIREPGKRAPASAGMVRPPRRGVQGGAAAASAIEAARLSLYPNPAAYRLLLDGLQPADRVQVFDLLGREVLDANGTSRLGLDVSALPPGGYLVRVTAEDGAHRQARFTVQR